MEDLIEKYANVPQPQRLAVAGLIAFVLVILHYWMIYDGQQGTIQSLQAQYTQKQNARLRKQNVAQNLPAYEAKLTETQRKLNEAKAKLPDSADVAQLLAQLGSRGQAVGLSIEEFRPQPEQKRGFYGEIAFDVRVEGSYHEVAMFIDSIGSMDRIVNVSDVTMGNPRPESGKVVVKGTFKVKTYRFVEGPG